MAVHVAARQGRLTDLILWAGRSAGFIVLILLIAFVLLRRAARTANKS
jgi:threonine/homoserine/homoserine lactone efflux protein